MIKRLSLLLIILLLCTAVAASFHHHEDGAAHSDCSICVALHLSSDTILTSRTCAGLHAAARTIFLLSAVAVVAKTCFSPANSRAPPA